MLRMTTVDGAIFLGRDHEELVRGMRADVWDAPARLEDYMAEVGDRITQMTGEPVCVDDAQRFVLDMERLGFAQVDEGVM